MAELGAGDALLTFTRSGIGGDSTYLAALLPAYYKKAILENIFKGFGLFSLIDVDPFPTRSGTTAYFYRYPTLSPSYSALTEGENPSPTQIPSAQRSASIVTLGGWVPPTDLAQMTTIDGLAKLPEIVKDWADSSMEMYLQTALTPYLPLWRADYSSTYQTDFVTNGAGSTTTSVDSVVLGTYANDSLEGGTITYIDPRSKNYGISRYATDNDTTTGQVTHAAFPYTTGSGYKGFISCLTNIANSANYLMDLAAIRTAVAHMRENGIYGPRFELPGGGYNIVLDAKQEGDLTSDTNITNLFIYKEKEDGIRTYKPGTIAMCKPTLTYYPFRSATTGAATYAANGVCRYAPIFGKNCMARLPIGPNDIQIIYKDKSSGGTSNPLEMYSTLGWKYRGAFTVYDSNAGRALVTG